MVPRRSTPRVLVVAGLVTLALAACGRRGALEPPPGTAADVKPAQQGGTLPSPVGTPRKNRPYGLVPPNQPFVLDPLL